jgi:hypothetical protein
MSCGSNRLYDPMTSSCSIPDADLLVYPGAGHTPL